MGDYGSGPAWEWCYVNPGPMAPSVPSTVRLGRRHMVGHAPSRPTIARLLLPMWPLDRVTTGPTPTRPRPA